MPKPHIDLVKSELALWQHDLWIKVIEGGKSDTPLQVDLGYHPALQLPAIGKYSATSPSQLRWFKKYNEGCAYVDQVKPFGFLTPLTANSFDTSDEVLAEPSKRRKRKSKIKPIAPFTTDPAIAGQTAFDRITGEPVSPRLLKSYADSIRQYHMQPENKFLNGNWTDRGKTFRRHVLAIRAMHIGKEANDLARQATLGYDQSAQPVYGYGPEDIAKLQGEIRKLCHIFSINRMAQYGGLTAKRINLFVKSDFGSDFASRNAQAIQAICFHFTNLSAKRYNLAILLNQKVALNGLRQTARELGLDPSNLCRMLRSNDRRVDRFFKI